MTTRRFRLALAAALLPVATACALDFDRFAPAGAEQPGPVDASVDPSPDASDEGGESDAAADVVIVSEDAETTDAGADDASAFIDGSQDAACTPSPSCIMSARMCDMMCAQQDQMCIMKCTGGACRSNCTRTENTCIGQCEDTCSTCTRSAGCSAAAACAADAGP